MTTPYTWAAFAPPELTPAAKADLTEIACEISHVCREPDIAARGHALEKLRHRTIQRLPIKKRQSPQRLIAAVHVLFDLAKQGWLIRITDGAVQIARPINPLDPEQDRLRIQQNLHAERDEQLRQESVRSFIKSMEFARFYGTKRVSILSLMGDGKKLWERLSEGKAIEPYLQFVRGEDRCELTDLRLVDIWRYFRHTWSTPYKSVPGRTMMILVRDKSMPFHPVIGIAALSSATVGSTVRDDSIGWTLKQVMARVLDDTSTKYARWMLRITDEVINDIYKDDLFEDGSLSLKLLRSPTPELISRLIAAARQHRLEHFRFMQSGDYKDNEDVEKAPPEYWEKRAKSLLFRSKREQELANMFQIRLTMNEQLGPKPSAAKFKEFIVTREGRIALTKLIRKAKADRVGTVIADLSICGAIPPYSDVLGGKLVAMLVTSPEVVNEYRRRYRNMPSIIASSMAAKRVVRPADLVYISTTSLYGRRPNQYDRISIPVGEIKKGADGVLKFEYLGRTRGIGTFQFSNDAVVAMNLLWSQVHGGQRVNSLFGEGVNPRLRKIRDGLDELGLHSNMLLDHGAPRLVYSVTMINNLADYLLGIDKTPQYILPAKDGPEATLAIGRWWFQRWCKPRLDKDGLVERMAQHTIVYPIRHGAKVVLPPTLAEDPLLFDD